MKHFRIWIKWVNTGKWQEIAAFPSAWAAREYVRDHVSTSGGRISRVEMREPTASTGDALFDIMWR